jgi:hypothetical protein
MNIIQRLLEDIFRDRLMNTKLFEMAYDRKKAMELITRYQTTIAEHFIKLLIYPDYSDVQHWRFEINEKVRRYINSIRLKPNNRKLRYEDYFKILYDEPLGHDGAVKYIVEYLVDLEKLPVVEYINYREIEQRLKVIYEELCDDIAIDNFSNIEKYL